MFNLVVNESEQQIVKPEPAKEKSSNKFKNIVTHQSYAETETQYNLVDQMLETEKINNKNDNWNKLNKTQKIQKLHQFAEKYGKDNGIPVKEIKALKTFFCEALDNNKLQKTKDVVYDKDKGILTSIPALCFNVEHKKFTLRVTDAKRVSTIKSLTPHRITPKNEVTE